MTCHWSFRPCPQVIHTVLGVNLPCRSGLTPSRKGAKPSWRRQNLSVFAERERVRNGDGSSLPSLGSPERQKDRHHPRLIAVRPSVEASLAGRLEAGVDGTRSVPTKGGKSRFPSSARKKEEDRHHPTRQRTAKVVPRARVGLCRMPENSCVPLFLISAAGHAKGAVDWRWSGTRHSRIGSPRQRAGGNAGPHGRAVGSSNARARNRPIEGADGCEPQPAGPSLSTAAC